MAGAGGPGVVALLQVTVRSPETAFPTRLAGSEMRRRRLGGLAGFSTLGPDSEDSEGRVVPLPLGCVDNTTTVTHNRR